MDGVCMKKRYVSLIVFLVAFAAVGSAWSTSETVGTTGTAEEALYRARKAAGEDRHREAIELYLRAIRIEPDLQSSVALELGHQYTWAEMPDSAIAWFTRYLDDHPGDIDASVGVARAMSWADDLYGAEDYYLNFLRKSKHRWVDVLLGLAKVKAWEEDRQTAEEIYVYILENDPENVDARLGLAEILNWSGKHREARRMYEAVLEEDRTNKEATKGLAQALFWLGRGDLAMDGIENAERDDDLDETRAAIRSSRDPHGTANALYSENTDDGQFRSLSLSLTVPLTYLTEVGAMYLHGTLTKMALPDIDRDQVWFSLKHRFNESLALVLNPGVEFNRFDRVVVPPSAEPVDDFDLLVWDAYLTVTPRDWVRFDAGSSRETMRIHEPVFRKIHVTTESGGLDWRLTHRVNTFWNIKYSSYSDGNSRFAALHRGEWNPSLRIPYRYHNHIVLIEGIDYFDFAKELDNGYFNPSNYTHIYAGLRFVTNIGKRTRLKLEGSLGTERDSGAGWASIGSFAGDIRFPLAGGVGLTVGYFKSGSRLTSPDGFRSEGVYITLDVAGGRWFGGGH